MCGIIARVGPDNGVDDLLTALENLEYRGYDSAGLAVKNGSGLEVRKREGEVDELAALLDQESMSGEIGIGHTRWSTHGAPSDTNAHPHTDCSGRVAVVHNGIIDNYDELKARLEDEGHRFTSETDTEVVPHLIESRLARGHPPDEAFRNAIAELSGSYAIAGIIEGRDAIYAARQGSPLVFGIGDGRYFLASDVPAFREYTDEVVYLEDGQLVVVEPSGYTVQDGAGNELTVDAERVSWDVSDAGKAGYEHYMLKEIHEQPTALRQTIRGRIADHRDDVNLADFPAGTFDGVQAVQFLGCGTSFHAARYAARFASNAGIPAQTFLAGEYASSPPPADQETLVVAVSQSGETADVLDAIRQADSAGARTVVVTNTVGSTATRVCDEALFIRAGPEIGVAATKTFSSQVAALTLLGERLVQDTGNRSHGSTSDRLDALASLPGHVQQLLDTSEARTVAEGYLDSDGYFFIGRGYGHSVALEGALKFKEITYEHAEGFAASELKHGPLALVTSETPVFAVLTGNEDQRTLRNMKEIQAREAPVIAVTAGQDRTVERFSDAVLTIPETHHQTAGVLANVQLQLVAYHAAARLGRSIDKPRNLAKSVTVT